MKLTALTAAVAVSLTALISLPAAADEVQVVVSYDDINLGSAAGAAALANRVKLAVDEACARPAARDLKRVADWQQCRVAAQASATAQLNDQGVTINP